MIKLLFCLRRLPALSLAEFHRYWFEQHAPLVQACAPKLNLRRYVQNPGFEDPRLAPTIEARGSALPPFDGVAELWWDSPKDLLRAAESREGRAAGRALLEDERRFIDLANSRLIYATEREIPLPAPAGAALTATKEAPECS